MSSLGDRVEKLEPDGELMNVEESLAALSLQEGNIPCQPGQPLVGTDHGSSSEATTTNAQPIEEVDQPQQEGPLVASPPRAETPSEDENTPYDDEAILADMAAPWVCSRCPYAWSPPRRKHPRFGFYSGPPPTAQNAVPLPLPFRRPYCPFGDQQALNAIRYFCVIPGPGYKMGILEQLWIVKMSLRDVYREMCYDRACRQLYPSRFLRRFVEIFPKIPEGRKFHFAYLPLRCSFDDHGFSVFLYLARSYCFYGGHTSKKSMEVDYARRWLAFVPDNSDYPRKGPLEGWSEYQNGLVDLCLVMELVPHRPRNDRDLRVRFPLEVRRYPEARTHLCRDNYTPNLNAQFHFSGPRQWWIEDPIHP
ncbi:hypothetical protein Emed_006050 [Eimeria media]